MRVHAPFDVGVNVRLTYRHALTGEVTHQETHNAFVDGGFARLLDFLEGLAANPPSHCALSDDAAPVTNASSGIGTEHLRKAITQRIRDGATLQFNTFFSDSEASGEYIQKVGLVNSAVGGVYFCIAKVIRRQKDPLETLTIEWLVRRG